MFVISVYSVRKDGSLGKRLSVVCVSEPVLVGRMIITLRRDFPRCYILTDYVNESLGKIVDNIDLPF